MKLFKDVPAPSGLSSYCLHAGLWTVPLFAVQTVPCIPLHGIGANEVMVSGHLPLAVGGFKWADAVTERAAGGKQEPLSCLFMICHILGLLFLRYNSIINYVTYR